MDRGQGAAFEVRQTGGGKRQPRRRQVRSRVEIPDSVLTHAVALLDRPLDDAYSILGMQLEATGTPIALHSLIHLADLKVKRVDFKAKAYELSSPSLRIPRRRGIIQ